MTRSNTDTIKMTTVGFFCSDEQTYESECSYSSEEMEQFQIELKQLQTQMKQLKVSEHTHYH